MLYLGIDQHARQITISLRDEQGDVLQTRQVSTQPAKINEFFQRLTRERLRNNEQFVAVLEVCGFNDWLIRMLCDYRCHKVILIQPDDRKRRKTDRRDAAALSELLWVNRGRFLQGKDTRLREWYKRVKRRRGATIARVAVMRKLATIIWHMLINQRLPRPGRATRGKRGRYLAKECVGSNRALKRTIATSRSDDDRDELTSATSILQEPTSKARSRRLRRALPVRSNPNGNRLSLDKLLQERS